MTSRLAFIHGFTQTPRSWDPIAGAFEDTNDVVLLDAPGHGAASGQRLGLIDGATELARVGRCATYVGYSMGGRFALHIALNHPALVEGLVLVSATAGIADAADRARRRAEDEQRAVALERGGISSFIDHWVSLPLFANLPFDAAGIDDRKSNTVAGLASSLRLAGTGCQEPLWDRLSELSMPVQIVAGALDPKFVAVAELMHDAIAPSRLDIVEGAGHTVHLERPDEFRALLGDFLA